MTHSSEEHLGASGLEPQAATARILPFQRPPTVLQRAIQMRAQELLERERERERERAKPAPLRWAVIFVLALLPVTAVVLGVDAFVRIFHRINAAYMDAPPAAEQPDATTVVESTTQQLGVVMLQPIPEESAQDTDRARQ